MWQWGPRRHHLNLLATASLVGADTPDAALPTPLLPTAPLLPPAAVLPVPPNVPPPVLPCKAPALLLLGLGLLPSPGRENMLLVVLMPVRAPLAAVGAARDPSCCLFVADTPTAEDDPRLLW